MIVGAVAAVVLQIIEGMLFALLSARVWWHSVIVPVDFLMVAIVCGFALVLAMATVSGRGGSVDAGADSLGAARSLGKLLAVAIIVHVALALAELGMLAIEGTAASRATLDAIAAYAPALRDRAGASDHRSRFAPDARRQGGGG